MGSEMASIEKDKDIANSQQAAGYQHYDSSNAVPRKPADTPNIASIQEKKVDSYPLAFDDNYQYQGGSNEAEKQIYGFNNGQPSSNSFSQMPHIGASDSKLKSSFPKQTEKDSRPDANVQPPPQIKNQYQSSFDQGAPSNQQPDKAIGSNLNPSSAFHQPNAQDQTRKSQFGATNEDRPATYQRIPETGKQISNLPVAGNNQNNEQAPQASVQQSSFSQKPAPNKEESRFSQTKAQPLAQPETPKQETPPQKVSQLSSQKNQEPQTEPTDPTEIYEVLEKLPDLSSEMQQIKASEDWKPDLKSYIDRIPDYQETNPLPAKGFFKLKDGSFYKGQFKGIYKHGTGFFRLKDNSEYLGFFKIDKFNTYGRLIGEDGSVYLGEWCDDKKNGQGKMLIKGSGVYEGSFLKDKRDGVGIFKWMDGSKYEGEFSDDCMQGKGTYTFRDGKVYTGQFFNNMFDGQGVLTKDGKVLYRGAYEKDKKHGLGTYIDESGIKYTGNWVEGAPKGKFTVVYPDGTSFEEDHK